jgi:hypothetical protein
VTQQCHKSSQFQKMIRFIGPLILKTTIIVLTLKYFSVVSANTAGSQKKPQLQTTDEQLPADIYKRFSKKKLR